MNSDNQFNSNGLAVVRALIIMLAAFTSAPCEELRKYGLDDQIDVHITQATTTVSAVLGNLPIGLAARIKPAFGIAVKRKGSERIIHFSIGGSTLRQTLDELAKADPDYEWRITDGVINILPKSTGPNSFTQLITGKIFDNFTIKNGTFMSSLRTLYREAKQNGVIVGEAPTELPEHEKYLQKINFSLRHASIINVLNEMVKQDRWFDWYIREYKDKILIFPMPRVYVSKEIQKIQRKELEDQWKSRGYELQSDGKWTKTKTQR